MRHTGMGFPNGPVDLDRMFSLPSDRLLMLITEGRYHGKAAKAAGKHVLLRAIPRVGRRPAELGWSPSRFVTEVLDKTDEPGCAFDEFVAWNELDLQDERGDHEDDFSKLDQRYALIGGFTYSVVQQLRGRLPQGTRLHYGAFTPDHDALLCSDRWRAAAESCDVLDLHAYDHLEDREGRPGIRSHYLAYRRAFPAMPLALTEWHGKGDVHEEGRILEWLAETMAADPLFEAAYRFIWRWDFAPAWWSPSYNVEGNPAMVSLFMNPPLAMPAPVPEPEPAPEPEPVMPDFPLPVDDAGNEWAPSKQDIIDGAIAVADEGGLPRDLMLALCLAESGEGLQSFERWYTWTGEAKEAIAARDRQWLQGILDRIAAIGTHDVSFGPCHQTWRWSPEYNGQPYDLQSILEFRQLYIQDHGHALRVAAAALSRLWATYGHNRLEALCRYNKPDGSVTAGVRARYANMLALAPSMLPAEPTPEPQPEPAPVGGMGDLRGQLPVRAGYDPRNPYPWRDINAVDSIDIHYTASPTNSTIFNIASYQIGPTSHVDFPAIAYHIMVDGGGQPFLCHDLDRRAWHNGGQGRNERAIGICYTGDCEPTAAQKVGIRRAIEWCQEQRGRELDIGGHKDSYSTQCPGPMWPGWRDEVMPFVEPAPEPQPGPEPSPEPVPADLDRLRTLVGVFSREDGVVIPTLTDAINEQDWSKVEAVVKFIRENAA